MPILRYEDLSNEQKILYDKLLWAIESKNGTLNGKSSEEILCELEAKDEQGNPKYTEEDIRKVLTASQGLITVTVTLLSEAVFHRNKKALQCILKQVEKYQTVEKSIFTKPIGGGGYQSLLGYATRQVKIHSMLGNHEAKNEAQEIVDIIKNRIRELWLLLILSKKQQELYDRLLLAIENKNGTLNGKSPEEILCELEAKDEQGNPKYTEEDIRKVLTVVSPDKNKTLLATAVFYRKTETLKYILKQIATNYQAIEKSIFTKPHYFYQKDKPGLSLLNYAKQLVKIHSMQQDVNGAKNENTEKQAKEIVDIIESRMKELKLLGQSESKFLSFLSKHKKEIDTFATGFTLTLGGAILCVLSSLVIGAPLFATLGTVAGATFILIGAGCVLGALALKTEKGKELYDGVRSKISDVFGCEQGEIDCKIG